MNSHTNPSGVGGHWSIFFLFLVLGSVMPAAANGFPTTLRLLSITNTVWTYFDQGSFPGETWMSPEFDDAAWPRGLGVFGFETTALPYPIQTMWPVGSSRISYYARTHFQWGPVQPVGPVLLRATMLLDDGAVLYLNGREIGRVRMPEGEVRYDTLAFIAPVEGQIETVTLPSEALIPGDNVLAVEVHQYHPISGDVVFGLTLEAIDCHFDFFLTPLPSQLTAYTCSRSTLVLVPTPPSGMPLQWYHNGAAIPGETNAVLVFDQPPFTATGIYWVEYRTPCGFAQNSGVSEVTVMSDDEWIEMYGATWLNGSELLLGFSRAIAASSVDQFNFTITSVCDGASLFVDSARMLNGTNLVLTTVEQRNPSVNYRVEARNLFAACGGIGLANDPTTRLTEPLMPFVPVTVHRQADQLEISRGDCGMLQSSTDLVHWMDVPDMPNPFTITVPSTGAKFYRVRLF